MRIVLFEWWWMVIVFVVVVATVFIEAITIEEIPLWVNVRPIRIHIKPEFVILPTSWVPFLLFLLLIRFM